MNEQLNNKCNIDNAEKLNQRNDCGCCGLRNIRVAIRIENKNPIEDIVKEFNSHTPLSVNKVP